MDDPERPADSEPVERVQLGVRMEKRLVKVLKGLAEFEGLTLGQLLEKIVLHSFVAVPGEEGEMAASPHSKRALAAVSDFKRIYGLDYELHRYRQFQDAAASRPGNSRSQVDGA